MGTAARAHLLRMAAVKGCLPESSAVQRRFAGFRYSAGAFAEIGHSAIGFAEIEHNAKVVFEGIVKGLGMKNVDIIVMRKKEWKPAGNGRMTISRKGNENQQ